MTHDQKINSIRAFAGAVQTKARLLFLGICPLLLRLRGRAENLTNISIFNRRWKPLRESHRSLISFAASRRSSRSFADSRRSSRSFFVFSIRSSRVAVVFVEIVSTEFGDHFPSRGIPSRRLGHDLLHHFFGGRFQRRIHFLVSRRIFLSRGSFSR